LKIGLSSTFRMYVIYRTWKGGWSYKNSKTGSKLDVCVKTQIYIKWQLDKTDCENAGRSAKTRNITCKDKEYYAQRQGILRKLKKMGVNLWKRTKL